MAHTSFDIHRNARWDEYFTITPRPLTPSEQQCSDGNSIRALSKREGVNPKAVAKWKKRDFVQGAPI